MHNSNELGEVASVLFKQIGSLTATPDRFNIAIANEEDKSMDVWITDQEGHKITQRFIAKTSSSPVVAKLFQGWEKQDDHIILDLYGKKLENWIRYMGGELGMPFKKDSVKDHRFVSSVYFSHGFIGITTNKEPDSETIHLLERFSKVFQQTYVRFLDLKNTEAQGREAEIQLALERVRAQSMAMHHSRGLVEVVRLLDKEIKGLGIQFVDATQIVTDFSNPEEGLNIWITVEGMDYLKKFHIPYFDHPSIFMLFDALKKGQNFYTEKYLKAEKNRFFRLLFKYSDFGRIPKERQAILLDAPGLVKSYVIHKNSILLFQHNGLNEFSAEDNAIFRRFGAVFKQSYTRFLDLQKAEAQAREAEIQLVLERVRAKTMTMQKSEDLSDAVKIVFDELEKLNLGMIRCGIGIPNNLSSI